MALKLSLPPFMLSDEVLGRAHVDREGRRVEPVEAHARAVRGDGEDLVAAAAVDLGGVGAGAALVQVGVVARVPDHAVVAALAEHLVVGVAAGQRVVARRRRTGSRSRPCRAGCRCRPGRTACRRPTPPVSVSLPAPPKRLARGSAPFALVERDRVVAGLAERPGSGRCWRRSATPPVIATAPPLTRMLPAASRLMTMLLPRSSPNTVRMPAEKEAVTAI